MSQEFSVFAQTTFEARYAHDKRSGRKETWPEISTRVARNVLGAVDAPRNEVNKTAGYIRKRKGMPGGRYLYASGRPLHQTQNCLCLRVEDSREGWSDLLKKSSMALMTGAGIGVQYSDVREEGAPIRRTGGTATGPIALMQMLNECGRGIMQGGSRRSAIWAGLRWSHPDALKFIRLKDWSPEVRAMKEKDFNFPATLDMTNISVGLDDEFFAAYHNREHPKHSHAHLIYWETVERMLKTGEPGFAVDVGPNAGEDLRNACTEVTAYEDSEVCNLGSVNLSRISTLSEMRAVTRQMTRFLLAGTVYSDVPYHQVDVMRRKSRRLGLGVLGIHEWLLQRGRPYGPCDELAEYLAVWAEESRKAADEAADDWKLSRPVKVRAIAPTGTIGIVAETTTGIEPVFCVAFKRRYLKHKTWAYQYVVDPTAKKLIDGGMDPCQIEDAYTLAQDPERRVAFQAWVQKFVDHGISSTINLPHWGSEFNNKSRVQDFGNMLIRYLPELRGITVYPDGARGGQPLTPIRYETAVRHVGKEYVEETVNVCDLTKGGSCGE